MMSRDRGKTTPAPLNDEEKEIREILSKVDNTTIEEGEWNVVVMETKSLAAEWDQISIYLGLPFDLIKGIKSVAGDCYQHWSEALHQWIRQNYNTKKFGDPSWRTLLKAIAGVDKRKFKKLASSHEFKGGQVQSRNHGIKRMRSPTNDQAKELISFADSGLSETAFIKPCLAFPFLKLEKASKAEEAGIHQRLYSESESIMNKFKDLFKATRQSLMKEGVTVKDLLKPLDCLGSVQPIFKGSTLPVLGCQLPELRKSDNVDDAMSVISCYCSFFNYRIVEEIINNLGTEQDKTNLKNYQEEFSVYAQRHIFECPSELGDMSEIGHANMFVTLDATYEGYTISHLYAFVSNLQRVLKLPAVSLRLCRIGPGSLKMIFQLPHSVQQATFPLSSEQEEALSGLGVVQLSCGDYQFTRHEDEEVDDPASDGDSDHTDSEGSVDSKNTMSHNVELESLDAGLVTAKSKDDSSVADSALGRSSLTSVTTARVTQFSEGPFEKEELQCDLESGMERVAIATSHSGENELHLTSYEGNLKEVKRLLEEKQLNPLETIGKTRVNALHYAAEGGQVDVMKYYIEGRGYNPAHQNTEGWTCLHIAAQHNHFDLVQYLVEKQNMDPMCLTKLGSTPLHLACVGGNASVVTYLINAMSKYLPIEEVVRCKGERGWPPIHYAACFDRIEVLEILLTKFKADPLATNNYNRVALHHAAQEGHLQTVKFLVQHKCNVLHMDKKKETPLHMGAYNGHLNVVKYFTLEQHCDSSCLTVDKQTPLHYAAGRGQIDVVKYLTLEQRCDPMCTDIHNLTPLHLAATEGKLEVVKFLIENLWCPTDIRGWRNRTPLELARRRNHHQVVKYLESFK